MCAKSHYGDNIAVWISKINIKTQILIVVQALLIIVLLLWGDRMGSDLQYGLRVVYKKITFIAFYVYLETLNSYM